MENPKGYKNSEVVLCKISKIPHHGKKKGPVQCTPGEICKDDFHLATRSITDMRVVRVDGHWHVEFDAVRNGHKAPRTDSKKLDKHTKVIKIDSVKDAYRVIFNADPKPGSVSEVTHTFTQGAQTVESIVRLVAKVAEERGRWTKAYNCQAFANDLFKQLSGA